MAVHIVDFDDLMVWCVIVQSIPYDEPANCSVFPCLSYPDAVTCLKEKYNEAVDYSDGIPDDDGYPERNIEMIDKEHYHVYIQDELDEFGEIQYLPFYKTDQSQAKKIHTVKSFLENILQKKVKS